MSKMNPLDTKMQELMEKHQWQPEYQRMIYEAMQDIDVKKFIEEHRTRLTDENIMRSAANIYEFVREKKKAEEGQSRVAPGFYPELILTKNHIEVTYVPTHQTQKAIEKRKILNRVHRFYMPKDIANVNLDDVYNTPERAAALEGTYRFLESFLTEPSSFHQGVYLHGPFGTGKTFLMGAMAYELAEKGYESALIHFPTFAYEMKQSIGDNTISEKLDPIRRAPILIIDDIGADSMSDWLRDDILGVILQYRMQEELPTFFTSNFTMSELEIHLTYSKQTASELKAKRIMERIKFLAKPIEMDGPNRRNH